MHPSSSRELISHLGLPERGPCPGKGKVSRYHLLDLLISTHPWPALQSARLSSVGQDTKLTVR